MIYPWQQISDRLLTAARFQPVYGRARTQKRNKMTRIITITSGKGGVGKTNISVNLALHLASLGYRTCLFDADLGLANINVLLGLNPEYDLEDVIENNKTVEDILIRIQ